MLEILKFIYSSPWIWVGFHLGGGWLIYITLNSIANVIDAIRQ